MWGGAPAQKPAFYELCDEMGILVWQEFPLACNLYPDDPDYLAVLDQESRSLISRAPASSQPCPLVRRQRTVQLVVRDDRPVAPAPPAKPELL
jgi:hypothetical protein